MIAEKIGNLEASFHTAIERLHQTTPPDGLKEASKRLASNLLADFLKDVSTPEPVVEIATETEGEAATETEGEAAPDAPVVTEGEAATETEGDAAPVVGEADAGTVGEVVE